MRKRTLAVLVGIVFLAASYAGYRWWTKSLAAWEFIPANASMIISSTQLQDSSFYSIDKRVDLKALPILQEAVGTLSIINWFNADPKQVQAFLKDKHITFSYHPRTVHDQGIIMYIPIANEKEEAWLNNPKIQGTRTTHHTFQGDDILDVTGEKSIPLFSYIIRNGYLIVSQHGELIEDVLRKSGGGLFSNTLQAAFELTRDGDYDLNIYTQSKSWQNTLLPQDIAPNIKQFIALLPEYQDYHLKADPKHSVTLSSLGNSTPESEYEILLDGTNATPFTHHEYISQQTKYFVRLAGNSQEKFQRNYSKWLKRYKNGETTTRLNQILGKDKEILIRNIGSEFILCLNEESNKLLDSKIALIEFNNFDELKPALDRISQESKTPISQFQGYDLYTFPVAEIPATLFGPLFKGFNTTFITYVAPYLVIGNTAQTVKSYIVDYENKLTWAQTPNYDSLHINPSAQIALVANVRKIASDASINTINPSIESMLIDLHYKGSKVYTDIKLNGTTPVALNDTLINNAKLRLQVEWPSTTDTSLTALQNNITGTSEILLTDQQYQLYEVNNTNSNKPELLTQLDGPILGKSFQVDFLNIGRPQRIVATTTTLFVIDEDDDGTITTLSQPTPSSYPLKGIYRVNGASESSARFILVDTQENIYLWERLHKKPVRLNTQLPNDRILSPIVSFQEGAQNLFGITFENGRIYVVDEKGNLQPGFPVDALTRLQSGFTWSQNSKTGQTLIMGITPQGVLSRIDLTGKIVSSEQLIRPNANSNFRILNDENNLDWLLVRTTSAKAAILNKDGNTLFEIENLQPKSSIKYHFFGSDNRFISIRSGNYTTLFDFNGRLIGNNPIPSNQPVSVTYQASNNELWIFTRSNNNIQVWSIKLR